MRIALIDFFPPASAPERRTIDILEYWREDEFLIVKNLVSGDPLIYLERINKNIKLLSISRVLNYGKYADLISFFLNTKKIVRAINSFDSNAVIISNPRLFYLSLFLRVKKIFMFRDYWRRRNPLSYMEYLISKYFAKKADMIITVTETLRKNIIDELNVPSENVFLLPNTCNPEKYDPIKAKNELKDELNIQNKKVIIYTGGINYQRGLDRFIDAFSKLGEDYAFLIIGDGPEKKFLEKKVENLGLKGKIHFLGKISHEKVIELLKISDIAINPLIKDRESEVSFPIKASEYLSAGLPIISDNVGEIPKIIEENELGLVLKTGKPEEIAEKIDYLLKNDDIRKKMSQNAVEYAKKYLDIRKYLTELREKILYL